MDEETLRKLWEITIPGVEDLAGLDPERSYRPEPPAGRPEPEESGSQGSSAGPLVLPLFTVARGDPEASSSPGQEEEGAYTTLVEPSPAGTQGLASGPGTQGGAFGPGTQGGASGPGSGSSPTPGPDPAAVVKDGAGRTWLMRGAGSGVSPSARPTLGEGQGGAPFEAGFLYQLREVVGKGGMGVVYRARQSSLQRDVAVKKILAQRAAPELQRRFLAEALVTGRLDHPNVVPVYDLGLTPEGETVLAMKLVEGTSWKRLLHPRTPEEQEQARKHDLTWHLGVLRSVGNAVAFAHSRDLVHLDLKPENVMVGEFGEVLVMDWGLAVEVTPEPVPGSPIPHRTQLRAPCGTPAYMAPELAEGRGADVGPWTDVFLLGAILLELITGRPPNRGATFRETVMMALRCPPRDIPLEVPADLAEICRKALARDPRERYQTVQELQAALDEHLAHRESLQVSKRAGDRLAACQRAAGRLLQRIHGPMPAPPQEVERERSNLYGEYAEAVAGFAQARLLWPGNEEAARGELLSRLSFAEAALLQGDLGLAEAQLALTDPESRTGQTLRQRVDEARRAQVRAARQGRALRIGLAVALALLVGGLSVGIVAVRRERDRAALAAADAQRQRDEAENQRGAAVRERARAEQRQAESLLQQGDLLGKAGRWPEARARLDQARELLRRQRLPLLPVELGEWEADRSAPAPLLRLPHAGAVTAASFLPGPAPLLLASDRSGEVRLWDAATGLPTAVWQADVPQRALLVLPGGRQAVGAGEDGALRVWELPIGRELRVLRGHQGPVTCLAATRDGAVVVSGGQDGTVRTWRVSDGSALSRERGHERAVTGVTVIHTRFAALAYSCGLDGKLLQWLVDAGRVREVVRKEGSPLLGLSYGFHPLPGESRDDPGDLIALATADHELELWGLDLRPGQRTNAEWAERARLRPHRSPISALAFTSGGRFLLSAGQDGRVVATDLEGEWSTTTPGLAAAPGYRSVAAQGPLLCLTAHVHGGLVAAGGEEGALSVWDLGLGERTLTGAEAEREARPLPLRAPGVAEEETPSRATSVALSPDRALAVAGTEQGPLLLWHVASGQLLAQLIGHKAPVRALRFLDERRLVSAAADGRVLEHDLGAEPPDVPVRTVEAGVEGAPELSPRGDALALVTPGRGVRLYGLPEGGLRRELPVPDARCAAFSPRGGLVLVGRAGGQVALFEAGSGREARVFRPFHGAAVGALAFSGDGTRALSGAQDGLVRAWETAEGRKVHDLRGHAAAVQRVGFSPDGALAWTAGADGVWRLWSVERGTELHAFPGPPEGLTDLAVDPELRLALSASRDGRVQLWQLARPHRRRALEPALGAALEEARRAGVGTLGGPALSTLAEWLAFSGAHRLALEACARGGALPPLERLVGAWALDRPAAALRALEEVARAGAEPAHVVALCRARLEQLRRAGGDALGRVEGLTRAVACSPDGTRVAGAGDSGEVLVWELTSGRLLLALEVGQNPFGLTWTAGGEWLVTGDKTGALRCFDPRSGQQALVLQPLPEQEGIDALVPLPGAPDAQAPRLLVGGARGTVALVTLAEGAAARVVLPAGERRIAGLAAGPDGRRAAVALGKVLSLVELETGEVQRQWELERGVEAVALLAGGRVVVASGRQVLLAEAEGEGPLEVLSEAQETVYDLAATPDGRLLAGAEFGGRLAVWDLSRPPAEALVWEARAPHTLLQVGLSPDGARVISGAREGVLRCWER